MNRHLFLAAPMALSLFSAQAIAAGKTPPPEYAAYVATVRKADAIKDPLQRCLAYPDLPGNTWVPGVAKARCTMFLTRTQFTLDDIDKLLAQPDGARTLDAACQALLDAHFKDPSQREQIVAFFSVFERQDSDKAERIARAWVAASPDSPFAHTALGHVLAQRGWDARGGKYIQQTAPEKVQAMESHFVGALKEYVAAMQANPKLIPACIGLMKIGRQSSDELQASATAQCIEADPTSYSVIDEMMTAAEPRWGGSDAEMRVVAAYAKAREAENPVLSVFEFNNAYYEIERMKDGDDQAIAVLEPASLQVPNAGYLRAVGFAYVQRSDYWKGFVYLSQALRFSPDYAVELRLRAVALNALGEPEWARPDAERAVELHPELGSAHQVLGDIVRKLEGPAAAIPYYQRAMQDSYTRESAFNDYCGALIDASRDEEAGKCLDELLAGYPENAEGWRQRFVLIGYDAPGAMEAMERFMALRDPEDKGFAATAETVRKVLAAKNGTATPSELFDSRMVRARAAERSPAGQAYYKRVQAETAGMLKGVFGTCQPAWKPGLPPGFATVMDVQPDGTLTNVVVQPVNAWSSCFAKQFGTVVKMPAPPEGYAEIGYPMAYAPRVRAEPAAPPAR